jgi:hypothetical protein
MLLDDDPGYDDVAIWESPSPRHNQLAVFIIANLL